MREMKKAEDSMTQQQYIVRASHINHYGRLFGGQLLMWIDELAGIVAMRHSNATVTTASIDNLQFRAPAFVGDLIVLQGVVTYVGSSSMEIKVDTYVESVDGKRKMINRAYFDMVAIDCAGKPKQIAGLILETEEQKQEFEAARKRKQMRKARRQDSL